MNPAMAAQYRNYQQHAQAAHPQRPQHATPARRGVGPMIPGAHGQIYPSPNAKQEHEKRLSQERNNQMERDATCRAKWPTDRNMPEGVEDLIVGNGVQEYKRLREVERKIDATTTRKRLELGELADRRPSGPRNKKMRIWITNTVENQPWQGKELDENAFDFSSGTEATYKLQIVGKTLNETAPEGEDQANGQDTSSKENAEMAVDGQDQPNQKSNSSASALPFSHFFKVVSVELDRSKALQQDGSNILEWSKPRPPPNAPNSSPGEEFDSLTFERKGDENINCTINLERDEHPVRYALSKPLSEIVDSEEATRAQVVSALWMYIKAMGLQRDDEKRAIQCDETLRAIFGQDTIYFPQIGDAIIPHLQPLPPVKLHYTIRVDPEFQANPTPTVYDILVLGEDATEEKIRFIRSNSPEFHSTLERIHKLDQEVAHIIQALNNSKARHSFFTSLSKDPTSFIKKWISSQRRDMEILLGDSRVGSGNEWMGDEFRRGGKDGVWGSENVKESVNIMVAKPGPWGR